MANPPDDHGSFGVEGERSLPVGPGHDANAHASFDPGRIDFGHYAWRAIRPARDIAQKSSASSARCRCFPAPSLSIEPLRPAQRILGSNPDAGLAGPWVLG